MEHSSSGGVWADCVWVSCGAVKHSSGGFSRDCAQWSSGVWLEIAFGSAVEHISSGVV